MVKTRLEKVAGQRERKKQQQPAQLLPNEQQASASDEGFSAAVVIEWAGPGVLRRQLRVSTKEGPCRRTMVPGKEV